MTKKKVPQKLVFISDFKWPDEALEVLSSAASPGPCCAQCEGLFWAGEQIIVVSRESLVHQECLPRYAKIQGIPLKADR